MVYGGAIAGINRNVAIVFTKVCLMVLKNHASKIKLI